MSVGIRAGIIAEVFIKMIIPRIIPAIPKKIDSFVMVWFSCFSL